MKYRNLRMAAAILMFSFISVPSLYAQNDTVLLTSATPYTQNFSGMSNTTYPTGFTGSTTGTGVSGGYVSTVTQSVTAPASGYTSGGTYKFTNAGGNVAIGILPNGTANTWGVVKRLRAVVKNNTGSLITQVEISFRYLLFRNTPRGAVMKFFIGTTEYPSGGKTFATGSDAYLWPAADSGISTVIYNVAVNPGESIELFWEYNSDGPGTGSRKAIGIDDITITPTLSTCAGPATAASALLFNNITAGSANASWTNGNGEDRLVFIKQTNVQTDTVPLNDGVDPATINANAVLGLGSQVGTSGWYCVYKGTAASAPLEGLSPYEVYRVQVVEHNACSGGHKYNRSIVANNPDTFRTLQDGDISDVITDDSSFCNGVASNVAVSFSTTLGAGNFIIELSDANGNFTTPQQIGSGTASPVTATIPALQAAGTGYQIRVLNNTGGSFVSTNTAGPIVVSEPVVINTPPAGDTLCAGAALLLSVASNGTTFQWLQSGTAILNATGSQYNVPAAQATDAGTYAVVVMNGACTDTSADAIIAVDTLPVVSTQPADATLCEGSLLELSADVSGADSMQWVKDNTAITNENGNTYSVAAASSSDAGEYYIELFNGVCSISTDTISVTVNTVSLPAVNASANAAQPAAAAVDYINGTCEMIASITTDASDLGNVQINETVGAPQQAGGNGDWYIGRYYEILPATQPTDPVSVSLYFTSQDFDNYNAVADASNEIVYDESAGTISNLFIGAFHGSDIIGSQMEEILNPSEVSFNGVYWTVTISVSSFSTFVGSGQGTPLPVNIERFSAVNAGPANVIEWSSGVEDPGAQYTVQKSYDGSRFENIYTVSGKGEGSVYSFEDRNVSAGDHYYRVAYSGVENILKYTAVAKVTIADDKSLEVNIYPNPSHGILNFKKPAGMKAIEILFTDVTGRPIFQFILDKELTTVHTAALPEGVYLVIMNDGIQKTTRKIVVSK